MRKPPREPQPQSELQTPPAEAAPDMAQPQAAAPPIEKPGRIRREAFLQEAFARFDHATTTDAAFVERLVMFWSNHFCVSANKGPVRGIAGAYEREAIRPHVLGRFADMLLAVEQHPAMLIYLDNAQSIGPNSQAGLNRGRGLNENLAREILELHTLGVGGGYTPGRRRQPRPHSHRVDGRQSRQCRIGARQVLLCPGAPRARRPDGARQALSGPRTDHRRGRASRSGRAPGHGTPHRSEACRALRSGRPARQPRRSASRRHSSTAAATWRPWPRTLVESPEAWSAQPAKVLPPYDFLVAVVRGFALEPQPQEMLRLSNQLGQPLWRPPAPAGWPDADTAWAAPSALRERLRIAEVVARRVDRRRGSPLGRGGGAWRRHGPSHPPGRRARRDPRAGAGAADHVARLPEEVGMTLPRSEHREPPAPSGERGRQPGACGASCQRWRSPARAIRACWSWCCAAVSTGWPPSRPWAIPTTRGSGAASRCPQPARARACPLDGFFALNGAMPQLHALYRKREALIVHAVHTPYRARSHFDGQDVLESGLPGVGRIEDGWLNRALASLPDAGQGQPARSCHRRGRAARRCAAGRRCCPGSPKSTACRCATPPLRGSWTSTPRPTRCWPRRSPRAWRSAASPTRTRARRPACPRRGKQPPSGSIGSSPRPPRRPPNFCPPPTGRASACSATTAGTRMPTRVPSRASSPCGSAASMPPSRRLKTGMGPAWKDTVAVIVTEFGRTARVNGTQGTDHGMATVALLVGGAVKGRARARRLAGPARRRALRGPRPCTDARSARRSQGRAARPSWRTRRRAGRGIFPDSAAARPLDGLVA